MSLSTGSQLPCVPAAGHREEAMRVLVAIGCEADGTGAVRELSLLAASCSCSVTLVGVVPPSLLVRSFAPMSGVTTAKGIEELQIEAALQLVRKVAASAGALSAARALSVDHLRAAASWTEAHLVEPLRLGVYDALILGRLPRGRRVRSRLLAAARASETEVIVGTTGERSRRP